MYLSVCKRRVIQCVDMLVCVFMCVCMVYFVGEFILKSSGNCLIYHPYWICLRMKCVGVHVFN